MNKKDYQKPTMQVVKLEQKCSILAESNGGVSVQNYQVQDEQNWDE